MGGKERPSGRKKEGRSAPSLAQTRPGAWPVTVPVGHHPGRPTGPDEQAPALDSAAQGPGRPHACRNLTPAVLARAPCRPVAGGGNCPERQSRSFRPSRAPRAQSLRRGNGARARAVRRRKGTDAAASIRQRVRARRSRLAMMTTRLGGAPPRERRAGPLTVALSAGPGFRLGPSRRVKAWGEGYPDRKQSQPFFPRWSRSHYPARLFPAHQKDGKRTFTLDLLNVHDSNS